MKDRMTHACEVALQLGRRMAGVFNNGEEYIGWIDAHDPALMAQQLMLVHAHAPSYRPHLAAKKAAMVVMYTAMGVIDRAREEAEDFNVLCDEEEDARERILRLTSGTAEGRTNE